ncbi:DUF5009 domain-containing protein [uncultured Chitinophaga sp.]|uniref:DUF5009 domain-containing protein n=1 Tax=uncultured Chitinophaga sp. TaxID=339340 RepID=UPI0025DB5414|nr:DUF5009 domain-containing protein [uncultured Chitinophaga sp.]
MPELKPQPRILSIDALRGITILVMIFVNELAGIRNIPQWAQHMKADADAMTFVDMVFPFFLFIVGMSVPFAVKNRQSKGDSTAKILLHIGFRTLGLLVLGLFMVNAESGYNAEATGLRESLWTLLFYASVILVWNVYKFEKPFIAYLLRGIGVVGLITLGWIYRDNEGNGMQVHWWGILGLIGWAYLFTSLIYLACKGHKAGVAIAIIASMGFFILGRETDTWASGQTGHAIHTGIALCGLLLSLNYFDGKTKQPYFWAIVFAVLLAIAAYVLRPYYTISKIWATPSWALYSAASCCVLYTVVYWITDVKGYNRWTGFLRPAAANPLLTYIIPSILYALMYYFHFFLFPDAWRTGWLGAAYCAVFALAVMGLVKLLNKIGIRLQL